MCYSQHPFVDVSALSSDVLPQLRLVLQVPQFISGKAADLIFKLLQVCGDSHGCCQQSYLLRVPVCSACPSSPASGIGAASPQISLILHSPCMFMCVACFVACLFVA
jgi:hypothetical protein